MTPECRISAIMPAYNAGRTILSAIQSVRWQTDEDWELIIVDDGSSDDTYSIAMAQARLDSRIKVVRTHHEGRGGARNRCLKRACGALIAICDSDDISLPERFAEQRALFDANADTDVVSCSRVISFAADAHDCFAVEAPSTDDAIRAALARGKMPILFASAMLRRQVTASAGGFDPELRRNQDFGLFARIFATVRFQTIPESLILYRTPRAVLPYSIVAENNFYRYYANRRARGETRAADEFRTTLRGRAHRGLVVPMQYVWYAARLKLGGRVPLRPDEQAKLRATLALLASSAPAMDNLCGEA